MVNFNSEERAKVEKRWAEMEAIKQTPQHKRKAKIASDFIERLLQECASDKAALKILSMARCEIAKRSIDFRAAHYPETIAPYYSEKRTVCLNEIFRPGEDHLNATNRQTSPGTGQAMADAAK